MNRDRETGWFSKRKGQTGGGGDITEVVVHQERWAETKSIRGCRPDDELQDLKGFCAMEPWDPES